MDCPSNTQVERPFDIARTVTTPAATPNPPITELKNVIEKNPLDSSNIRRAVYTKPSKGMLCAPIL